MASVVATATVIAIAQRKDIILDLVKERVFHDGQTRFQRRQKYALHLWTKMLTLKICCCPSLSLSPFLFRFFYRCWSEEHSNQLLRINHHQHHHICLRSYSRCRLFHCNAICYCSRLPVIVVSIVTTTAVVCCCPMVSCVCKWLLKLKR